MAMSPNAPVRVLGIAGSLRAGSYNRGALRYAQSVAPEGLTVDIFELKPLPLYDADMEANAPQAARDLWKAVADHHAILFVTPEYNFSMAAPMKNAIDWISRDPAKAFAGKPCAMMGASRGILGTARAQFHLRQSLVILDMHPVNVPQVYIGSAPDKFDKDSNLTDQASKDFIAQLLVALRDWTWKIG
jgi:chromate reductase